MDKNENGKSVTITKDTRIPLGLVLVIVGAIFTGMAYMTTLLQKIDKENSESVKQTQMTRWIDKERELNPGLQWLYLPPAPHDESLASPRTNIILGARVNK